ncbi:hypothetical protein [Pedobacter sp. KACC 23697]|uniref:Uncharacterized protein n=1 Tax=Pedobacter sp. KACC 23697 TaxID=3149230 RepID=A0AAU7KBX8_9SPHI
MFQLILIVIAQAQLIGFGFWSIWYGVFHVSPAIQKLDSTPGLVIKYAACIYLIFRISIALFNIFFAQAEERYGYIDFYFGPGWVISWIDVIWYLILSQLLWINFFLKSRWYRLFNGMLAIIPLFLINRFFEWYIPTSYNTYLSIEQVNIAVFYLINLSIYLMMMLVIRFFIDRCKRFRNKSLMSLSRTD